MQLDRRRLLIPETLAQRRAFSFWGGGIVTLTVRTTVRLSSPYITAAVLPHCLARAANTANTTRVELPLDYNDAGTWPMIRFTSSIFNPMVSPTTGELDLKSVFPEWVPGKHYMVTALTYLKKVFYMKDFSFPRPANPEAQALFQVSLG